MDNIDYLGNNIRIKCFDIIGKNEDIASGIDGSFD
jgi:hypothetical protein